MRRSSGLPRICGAPRALAILAIGCSSLIAAAALSQLPVRRGQGSLHRMSFHNRLLLNRAAVTELQTLEVMLLSKRFPGRSTTIGAELESLGGRILKYDDSVGYLRVAVPTTKLLALAASDDVAAYQIASLSRGSWYRDGPPLSNAQMYRGFEVSPPAEGASEPNPQYAHLPVLSLAASRDLAYSGDDDVGIEAWMKAHPTFDGRGVTIALLESAQPSFLDATLGAALTLDGREVPKIAGILNTIDAEQPDATRVLLDTRVDARTTWVRIDGRTWIFPRRGPYRFGIFTLPAGANLVHEFGVIRDEATGEVRVDTNGNADFRDDRPVPDVNERFEPRVLRLAHPRSLDLSFVLGRGRTPNTVHIYTALGSHLAMTLSVAAGSRTNGSLAFGVAPNARVLLVRNATSGYRLADLIESFLETAGRRDVDVVNASAGLQLIPDTAADFAGLALGRAAIAHDKPIIDAAGNRQLWLSSASARGETMTVGGSMGPRAFNGLYGGAALDNLVVHPYGAGGPALDGAIKPDYLAPMERLSADLPWNAGVDALAVNAPLYRVPAGYQISCCTSASSPYAAGVAALLISGAKQERIPYSHTTLARAMRIGARFLRGFQSYQQGNGVLDVNGAWQELRHSLEVPRIVSFADVVHPLALYAANGSVGQGILEFEGWTEGMSANREIRLRRESGSRDRIRYRTSWTGNDGTFRSVSSVTLPLNAIVPVPIAITPSGSGVHSALLNVHDSSTDRIVFRTQATIVVAGPVDPATGSARMAGTVPLMRTSAHFVHVPAGVSTVSVELEVTRGVLRAAIIPAHGLYPNYYNHLHPGITRPFPKGRYTVTLPDPEAGTWGIYLTNDSLTAPVRTLTSGDEAAYTITVRTGRTSLAPARSTDGSLVVNIVNSGSTIREPVLDVSPATLKSHSSEFLANGMPNLFDVSVPAGASTLALDVTGPAATHTGVELYLYDCTSGECFSYDIGFPAASRQKIVVRNPTPGRWVAAVNAAPFPLARGRFVLDEIIASGNPHRFGDAQPRSTGAQWSETLPNPPALTAQGGGTPVLLIELLDLSVERSEAARSWDPRSAATKLRNQPVALGRAVLPLSKFARSPR